jgi:anti-sigma regulatory factor (Ser/Thr protein kinase)
MQRTPDLKGDIANRQEGGLGIFLTQQMSDRISYQWQDGKNVLEIGFDFV